MEGKTVIMVSSPSKASMGELTIVDLVNSYALQNKPTILSPLVPWL
jgi:hypothetical protein